MNHSSHSGWSSDRIGADHGTDISTRHLAAGMNGRFSLTTVLAVAIAPLLGAQSRAEDTRVEIEHLGASAYHLRITDSAGVTNLLASLGAEGALLIDHLGDWRTRIADTVQARVIRDTMARVHPAPLRFLVNTHAHGDHTGGNEIHGATAVIIAHAGTRAALREPDPFGGTAGRLMAEHGLPTLIFEDSLTVHLNGETIRLVHFGPAHTSGDLAPSSRGRASFTWAISSMASTPRLSATSVVYCGRTIGWRDGSGTRRGS